MNPVETMLQKRFEFARQCVDYGNTDIEPRIYEVPDEFGDVILRVVYRGQTSDLFTREEKLEFGMYEYLIWERSHQLNQLSYTEEYFDMFDVKLLDRARKDYLIRFGFSTGTIERPIEYGKRFPEGFLEACEILDSMIERAL